MASFYEVVQNYLTPYYWYILIIVCFIIFGFLGKYAYDTYYNDNFSEGNKDFNDVANANMRDKDVNVYFFFVDWCPHCKTALPEWVKFKNQFEGQEVNGYTVNCIDMNCTDENDAVTQAIQEYKIEGYPTIKMNKDNKVVDFDAKISYGTLEKFVNMMTKQ